MIEQLTDALISICRQFGVAERTAVCCGEVNVAQCVALQFLACGGRSVGELADYMGVTRSSATKLADGMEEKGWIQRVPDPTDGRRVRLQLATPGVELADQLRARTESIVKATVSGLSKHDTKSLLRALQLLEQTLGTCCGPDFECQQPLSIKMNND